MRWIHRTAGLGAAILYLVVGGILVYLAYAIAPPDNGKAYTSQEYKDFALRAGIGLTAAAAFVSIIVSFVVLQSQITAAQDLADKNRTIQEGVELLKSRLSQHGAFLSKALDTKLAAYNALSIAANGCYGALGLLERGEFRAEVVQTCEAALHSARGTVGHLGAEESEICRRILQAVMNIADAAAEVKARGQARKEEYAAIWKEHAPEFGRAMKALEERSMIRTQELEAKLIQASEPPRQVKAG